MERLDYWRQVSERQSEIGYTSGSDCVQATGERRAEAGETIFVWGGRELSAEAYLAVPTFLRRGLRPDGA